MPMNLNATKTTGESVANPLTRINRMHPIYAPDPDAGKLRVFVEYYVDQAAMDAGNYFSIEEKIVDTPTNLETLINTQLKTLPEFSAAT